MGGGRRSSAAATTQPTPLWKGFYRTSGQRWQWWRARVLASWRDDGAGAPWAKASTTMTPVGTVFPIEGVVFPACLPRVKTQSIGRAAAAVSVSFPS